MLIHPKKTRLGAPGFTHRCGATKRSRALRYQPPPSTPGIRFPTLEKKKKKKSFFLERVGETKTRRVGKYLPLPKISCPKRAEVGAPPPYRSIRLNFRKCPLISIYFNENFGSSWSWWFMIKSIKLRPLRACGFFSDFIRQQIKRLVKNLKFSWRRVKIIPKLRKFNAKQFSAKKTQTLVYPSSCSLPIYQFASGNIRHRVKTFPVSQCMRTFLELATCPGDWVIISL